MVETIETSGRTPFIGRESELSRLQELLAGEARLLTITGPPGMGKTRLARRFAALCESVSDSPWSGASFSDLSSAWTVDDIVTTVSASLGLRLASGEGSEGTEVLLGRAMGGRGQLLVVLDNFEQVAAHGSDTVSRWLDLAPEARFLVTSRDRLRLRGEICVELSPLSVEHGSKLFESTAKRARTSYQSNPDEQSAVDELVGRLDGIPLAIELAAARVTVMSPSKMLGRLSKRFDLLRHGPSDGVARQATLRAAIDWSWDLLEEVERDTLAQSSVFRGGFSLEAAEAVIELGAHDGEPDVLDILESLRGKSLVRTYESALLGGELRFDVYESIREYAAERLAETGGSEGAEERHCCFCVAEGESRVVEFGAPEGSALQWFEVNRDNLVAAYHRRRDTDPELAARIVLCLSHVMLRRGPYDSNLTLLEDIAARLGGKAEPLVLSRLYFARGAACSLVGRLDAAVEDLGRALQIAREHKLGAMESKALLQHGLHALRMGQLGEAVRWLGEAEQVATAQGLQRVLCRIHVSKGMAREAVAEFAEAEASYQSSLSIARAEGDHWEEVRTRSKMGSLCTFMDGRLEEAREHFEWALAECREEGDWFIEAGTAYNLGRLETNLGNLESAERHLTQALLAYREMGNRSSSGFVVMAMGLLAMERGEWDEAVTQLELADSILAEVQHALARSYAMLTRALVDLAQEQPQVALQRIDAAITLVVALKHRVLEGIGRCVEGMIHARLDRQEDWQASWNRAHELLGDSGWGEGKAMLAALGAYGVLVGEPAQAADELPPFARARVGLRLLKTPAVASPTAATTAPSATMPPPPQGSLRIHSDGRWFQVPGSEPVDLTRKRTLRPLLLMLTKARLEEPGTALAVEPIFEAVWAGERIRDSARKNRVYVAVATLRKAGLDPYLETRGDGYLIRPDVEVVWAN